MNARKVITKHRTRAANWIARPASDKRTETMAKLRKHVSASAPRAAAVAAVQLIVLAIWYARRGTCAVLGGDPEGWNDLLRVLRYRACAIEVDPGCDTASSISLTFLNAVAFGEQQIADRMMRILLLAQDDPRELGGWHLSPLPKYSVRLWGLSEGQDVMLHRQDCPECPVLDKIFEAWNDSEKLTAAIALVCDWHLVQSLESTPDYPSFVEPPYELLAVEVLALVRVRERLGLPLILPQHPLLELPLAHPPREFTFVSDEALDLVRARDARAPVPEAARYRDTKDVTP